MVVTQAWNSKKHTSAKLGSQVQAPKDSMPSPGSYRPERLNETTLFSSSIVSLHGIKLLEIGKYRRMEIRKYELRQVMRNIMNVTRLLRSQSDAETKCKATYTRV